MVFTTGWPKFAGELSKTCTCLNPTSELLAGPGIDTFESHPPPPWPWKTKSNSSFSPVQNLLLSGQIKPTLDSCIRGFTCKMSPDAVFHLFFSIQEQHEFSLSSIVKRRELDWARMRLEARFSPQLPLGENSKFPSLLQGSTSNIQWSHLGYKRRAGSQLDPVSTQCGLDFVLSDCHSLGLHNNAFLPGEWATGIPPHQ